jgi:carboxylate-amine ligase
MMELAFRSSDPFTVGIEEELLLVDPATRALSHTAEEVLARMAIDSETAGHEAYACELELRSPPSATVGDAAAFIDNVRARARAAGATLLGSGLHPTAPLGDARLVDAERYRRAAAAMRGLFERTPECALHIHIGMPDPDSAIRAFNGLRAHLPLLQGLAASSPWWFGVDSGLASARFSVVRAFPGRGVPDHFHSYDQYAERIDAVVRAGGLDDYTFVWWDVRLHPRLGTVEVREMDAQSSLADAAAIAALVQSLARHETSAPAQPPQPPEAIAQSSFRASRDGLDATILHDGSLRPLREVVRAALELARPHARELGCADELDGVERMLREGNGASRQRAAVGSGGSAAMIDLLVAETAAPLSAGRI